MKNPSQAPLSCTAQLLNANDLTQAAGGTSQPSQTCIKIWDIEICVPAKLA
jgi:hypothetical protein